jgi:hypothetical protein
VVASLAFILPTALLLGTQTSSAQPPAAYAGTVVAVQGTNSQVYIKANINSAGYGGINPALWYSLGGQTVAPPAVVDIGNQPYYIATGTNGALFIRTINTGWNQFAPSFCFNSPSATWNGVFLYVACRGGDSALWVARTLAAPGQISFPSVVWTDYGGGLSDGPATVLQGGFGSPPAFVAPTSSGLVWYHGPAVSDAWVPTNENCVGGHLAADSGPGKTPVGACRGPDAQAWFSFLPGIPPFVTDPQGGVIVGGPGVTSANNDTGSPIVYAMGTDGQVWAHDTNAPTFAWAPLGGQVLNGVEAAYIN